MKPVNSADRRVVNIHDVKYRPYVFPDGTELGDEILQLGDDRPLGVGFHIYRMPKGMTSRPHRHNGHEQFLVLEGTLIENDGTVFKPGDMVWLRDGTEHCSYAPQGCLLAVHISASETTVP